MSSWTHGAQVNEMSHFSTTRTLSDFPLLWIMASHWPSGVDLAPGKDG
jgi:hypothetical protein